MFPEREIKRSKKPQINSVLRARFDAQELEMAARVTRLMAINHLPPLTRNETVRRWLKEDGLI